jgi:hypothetical protein
MGITIHGSLLQPNYSSQTFKPLGMEVIKTPSNGMAYQRTIALP